MRYVLIFLFYILGACAPSPLENTTLPPGLIEVAPSTREPTYPPTNNPTTTISPSPGILKTITPTSTHTITVTPTPTLGIGSNRVSPIDGMTLVYIPGGEFIMGTGHLIDAVVHAVYLDTFWMDKTEVTNGMFAKFLKETGYLVETNRKHSETESLMDHPAVLVSWKDANTYCNWAVRRLPTEAEWEKAARGIDGQMYPWGNEFVRAKVNIGGDGDMYETTAPVASIPGDVSPYGVFDMAGNVSEFVNDWYSPIYYEESPYENPQGPTTGSRRVVRGNFWLNTGPELSQAAARSSVGSVDYSSEFLGFRCAVSE